MDLKVLARFGAVVLLMVAVMAAAFELHRDGAPKVAITDTGRLASDPLAAELVRCRDLGAAAANDLGCKKAWAENRQRFLGPAPPLSGEAPGVPSAGDASVPRKDQSQMEVGQPSHGGGASDGAPQRRDAE